MDIAKKKYPKVDFQVLDINVIHELSDQYDLIFSNFGGLNYLSPKELQAFFEKAKTRLTSNGKLMLVIMVQD